MKMTNKLLILITLLFISITANSQSPVLKLGGVRTDTVHISRLSGGTPSIGNYLQWNGTSWTPANITLTLDEAYNNSTVSTVTVDGAQGQGDLVFNLTSTKDFVVQDNGTARFTVTDLGAVIASGDLMCGSSTSPTSNLTVSGNWAFGSVGLGFDTITTTYTALRSRIWLTKLGVQHIVLPSYSSLAAPDREITFVNPTAYSKTISGYYNKAGNVVTTIAPYSSTLITSSTASPYGSLGGSGHKWTLVYESSPTTNVDLSNYVTSVTGAANRVAYFDADTSLTSSADFTYLNNKVNLNDTIWATHAQIGNTTDPNEYLYGPLRPDAGFNMLHKTGDWRSWLSASYGTLSFGQTTAGPSPADLRGFSARTNGSGDPQPKQAEDANYALSVQVSTGSQSNLKDFYTNSHGIFVLRAITDTVYSSGYIGQRVDLFSMNGTGSQIPSGNVGFRLDKNNRTFIPYRLSIGSLTNLPTATLHIKGEGTGTTRFPLKVENGSGTNILRIRDDGYSSFGTVAPGTTQKVLISQNEAGTTTTALALDNNVEPTDGSGTRLALRLGSTDQFSITASDPVGGYTRAYDISAYMGSSLQTAITINGNKESTRFNTALEVEVYNGTSTTETLDGKSSSVYIPSSATTTTINLPTIVTGVPSANEVSVGYIVTIYIDRDASVTINSLNSDEIMLDGATSKVTSTTTTGGTHYIKTFTALASNLWGVK